MSTPNKADADRVRPALVALSHVVREMNPLWAAKKIPSDPARFNLLARPYNDVCRICNLPGHHSDSVNKATACRTSILSLIGFWEDTLVHISFLYKASGRFREAVVKNEPTYEMRLDKHPVKGGDMEVVLVDRLTRNYLKFQAWWERIKPKAKVLLREVDEFRFESVTGKLNGFLLDGMTLSELFERSLDKMEE